MSQQLFPRQLHTFQDGHFWPCATAYKFYEPRHHEMKLYDTPWEKAPRLAFFHDDECAEPYIHADSFGYRDCESCGRTICQQHPGNGWQWQFREHEDLGEICLKCYQDEILENGQPASDFHGNKIKGGMFFSTFNPEPPEAGLQPIHGFDHFFVNDGRSAEPYNITAPELISQGDNGIRKTGARRTGRVCDNDGQTSTGPQNGDTHYVSLG
jgi:hypothetical protein